MLPPEALGYANNMNVRSCDAENNQSSDLDVFSDEELAVTSRVLMAILHAENFEDLLNEFYLALSSLYQVNGCAVYRVSDHGRGLQIAFETGDRRDFLPDIIPIGSAMFQHIASKRLSDVNVSRCDQPSLFDDQPLSMFGPITVDGQLIGALAILHRVPDVRHIHSVLSEAVIALELLCKVNSFTSSLSMPAHFDASENEPQHVNECESFSKLTPREKEVLVHLTMGLSNKEIADKLCISSATCKHHVENILVKLNVHNRAAAVAIGLANTPHPSM